MKRVNIDRDVQSRKRIAASRPTPPKREQPKIQEPPKDEPEEEIKEAAKATETEIEPAPVPAVKPKKQGRPPEGDA